MEATPSPDGSGVAPRHPSFVILSNYSAALGPALYEVVIIKQTDVFLTEP